MDIINMPFSELKKYTDSLTKEEKMYILPKLLKDSRKNVISLANRYIRDFQKEEQELCRIKKLYEFDLSFGEHNIVAGADEVGRGPLAGPIVAAAVILNLKDEENYIKKLNDSKKLSEKVREELSVEIKEKAVSYNIALLDNRIIDERGISWCNNGVLKISSTELTVKPSLVLSDGYPIKNIGIENKFIIKGDSKSASIAAASIIAKVYRDHLMKEYAVLYPQYGFERNAGYGTEEHIAAIRKYGYTPIHRMSFIQNIINGK